MLLLGGVNLLYDNKLWYWYIQVKKNDVYFLRCQYVFSPFQERQFKDSIKKMLNFKMKKKHISSSNEMIDKILSMLTVCTDWCMSVCKFVICEKHFFRDLNDITRHSSTNSLRKVWVFFRTGGGLHFFFRRRNNFLRHFSP